MTFIADDSSGSEAGTARTLIFRLRHEPENGCWRGHALCVQTGAKLALNLVLDDATTTQLAETLQQLLTESSEEPRLTG